MCYKEVFYKNGRSIAKRWTESWLNKNPTIKQEFLIATGSLDNSFSLREKIFCFCNKITITPVCLNCSQPVHIHGDDYPVRFRKYCSQECSWNHEQRIEKLKETKAKQDHKISNQKRVRTMIEKYGVSYNSQREEIKPLLSNITTKKKAVIKSRQTKLKKYGYEFFPPDIKFANHSKEELEVQNFLNEELGFNFQHSRIGRYDIDLYDKDKMFAVEYNGEYWHTEQFKKDKFLHYHKMLECQNHGIRLITINASEWRKRKNQVKEFLRASLGIFHLRIFARKCEVLEVDINIGKEFLKKYHIQGSSNSNKFIYGLFYDKELLGVVSFGLHHRNNKQIVLNRLVFKDGIQVVGGATKIVTNAMKHQNINEVVSWSDNRLSIGNVYEKMGFVLEEVLNPDYCYIGKEGQLHSKQSMKKSNTKCPSHITEKDFCASLGYYRMWDCGKKRWKLTINKEMHLYLSAVS